MALLSSLPGRLRLLRHITPPAIALLQRIAKSVIAIAIASTIALLPPVRRAIGTLTFLAPMVPTFAHPGQRVGLVVESLSKIVVGTALGLAWSLLGLYLSSLPYASGDFGAAYTIRGVFLLGAALFHGFLRSMSPRLFLLVLWLMLITITAFLGPEYKVTLKLVTSIVYPIIIGAAASFLVSLVLLPELSSSFLGKSTVETLSEVIDTLDRATAWFVTPGGDSRELKRSHNIQKTRPNAHRKARKAKSWSRKFFANFENPLQTANNIHGPAHPTPLRLTTLASLTEQKAKMRNRLGRCKAAQKEVNYEISISALPPAILKLISSRIMASLVQNIIALIGACENKFVLLGSDHDGEDAEKTASSQSIEPEPDPEPEPGSKAKEPEDPDKVRPDMGSLNRKSTRKIHRSSTTAELKEEFAKKVQLAKPHREMESGDAKFLESMLAHIRPPVEEFVAATKDAASLVIVCIAYCYDVSKLPSGASAPTGINLAEIDVRVDAFTDAIADFDRRSAEALEEAARSTEDEFDMMPRMETFLVSTFLLGLRQAALHALQMLHHARTLVEKRQRRGGRSRLWLPQFTTLRQWLEMGGEEDGNVMPRVARKDVWRGKTRAGAAKFDDNNDDGAIGDGVLKKQVDDEENVLHRVGTFRGTLEMRKEHKEVRKEVRKKEKEKEKDKETEEKRKQAVGQLSVMMMRFRGRAADAVEWVQQSDDLLYAVKLAVAVLLVSWPGLIKGWNGWYVQARGSWASLQLILVFEVAIGSSMFIFVVRLFGVLWGCLCGYLSYLVGGGNIAVMAVILALGAIPSFYVLIGTPYVKAGMIALVSMNVVAVSILNSHGPAWDPFYKRLVAFVIGGTVAVMVEVVLYPVRARDRLVESLSSSLDQVVNMQAAMTVGVDEPLAKPDLNSPVLHRRFSRARNKAQAALAAADTFLPFCLTEPRLKGSFAPLAPIYREIIYVIQQVIDRMDGVMYLRKEYGSSVLQDLNSRVYAYRRHVTASICLALFAVNEALTTRLPLPQFLPSSRVAQLRLVSRVRDILTERSYNSFGGTAASRSSRCSAVERGILGSSRNADAELDEPVSDHGMRHRFLSWNAANSGQMEIIEYVEELVELTKLLVGVNAFRSGMLERPNYRQYARQIRSRQRPRGAGGQVEEAVATGVRIDTEEGEGAGVGVGGVGTATTTAAGSKKSARQRRATSSTLGAEGGLAGKLMGRIGGMRRREEDGDEAIETDSDEDDQHIHIPISLQRVSTRLRQDNSAERRQRALTFTGGQRPRDVLDDLVVS